MVIRCDGFFSTSFGSNQVCVYTVADIRLLWFCCIFSKWFQNQYDSHMWFRYIVVVKENICSSKLPRRLCDYRLEMQCFDWVCRLFVWCWWSIMICFTYKEKCYFNERWNKIVVISHSRLSKTKIDWSEENSDNT